MHEVARWLSNPLVLTGLCAIVGGGLMIFVSWAFTGEYERGGRDSVHRRPKRLEPWHVEPVVPVTQAPARHRLDTVREETTNLGAYARHVSAARAMLPVPITRQGERTAIEGGDHAGETRRVRLPQKEDVQEEGSEDRERRQDEGRPFSDGEEGGSHPEASREVGERNHSWFRNTITGEIVMVDGYGRRIEWDNGEEERYPS